MATLLYTAEIVGIASWIILSVFPGLYLATMALGAPNAPRNRISRIALHIIYAVVIGFIIELLCIICLPIIVMGILMNSKNNNRLYLGYF
jgi:hypothetical protein